MTTFVPRALYSDQELDRLYPAGLQLQLVQILLRHGERSPVSPRFQNSGLHPHWPYCNHARQLTSILKSKTDWDNMQWRRRLETFDADDGPIVAAGPGGEFDAVCLPGELTDKGRETTLALGERLRHLYVDQLKFMPQLIADSDMIYLRATPIPRALESVQQAFWGFYPPSARTADFPPPTILSRSPGDETLYPNDANCRRFAQLSRAFGQRAADRWNESDEMKYLNKLISKWMPETSPRVKVDSSPRLSGIMDTINATLAHGPETRLPKEFYDAKGRAIIEKIGVEEWYAGYTESQEYRALGIGSLLGDMVSRMVGNVERKPTDGILEIGGENGDLGHGRGGEKHIKLAMSGCHDTTLAAVLSSLGAFAEESWPPFTSHIAIELLKKQSAGRPEQPALPSTQDTKPGWFSSFFTSSQRTSVKSQGISRRPVQDLTSQEKKSMEDYYVRVRYNDKIMSIPGCKPVGKHLNGDESLCTLEAFKSIVDKFTPKNWRAACQSNLGSSAFPGTEEPAGY